MPTVLITGANRGLGLEFARQYAAADWTVIGTARERSPELDELGVAVEPLDMIDVEAVTSLGDRLSASPLDLLIANAGTNHPMRSDSPADAREWANMLSINAIAPFMLAKSLLPQMAQGAKLIAISSRMGSIGDNDSGGWIPYRTSKAALNAAWRSLAIDVRPRGPVAAMLHPGWAQTRMGGPSATLPAEESVASMRRLIETLGLDQSGGFFNYDGAPLPW